MPRYQSRNRCSGNRKGTIVTVTILGILIPVVFLSYYAFGQNAKPRSTVVQVSVLFRHGDRTPTDTYPKDPYKDPSVWSEEWGALTTLGKQQLYRFGQFLRKRYDGFLDENYSPKDIYVTSSDHDRCLMSAQVCLAGLYPPTEKQIWNSDLKWQPIPVHTTPRDLDQLIVVKKSCPLYDKELKNAYESPSIQQVNSENKQLYETLQEHTGKKIDSILDVELLYNTLEIEERNQKKLPEWTREVYPEKMRDLAALSLAVFTQTETMKRLKGGPIVADVVKHMTRELREKLGSKSKKMYLYSGHDLTIVCVLRALGIEELIKPDNGAAVIFELHLPNDNSDYFVQVLYVNNTEQSTPHELQLPNCKPPCKLKTFEQITKPVRPDNWDLECQKS